MIPFDEYYVRVCNLMVSQPGLGSLLMRCGLTIEEYARMLRSTGYVPPCPSSPASPS